MSDFTEAFERAFKNLVVEPETVDQSIRAEMITATEGLYVKWVGVLSDLRFSMSAVATKRHIHLRTHIHGPEIKMALTDSQERSKHYRGVDAGYIVFRLLLDETYDSIKEYRGYYKHFAKTVARRFLNGYLTGEFSSGFQRQLDGLRPTPASLAKAQAKLAALRS